MPEPTDAAAASPDTRQLPPVANLTLSQVKGHSCVHCGTPITHSGRPAGTARGHIGAHNLDTQVYAGPCCPQETP